MTTHLSSLLDFVSFTHDFREIERSMWVRGIEQRENDSEHSYQVAICTLYIIQDRNLPLDPFRTMGMALVHDVLEIYSGDTPIFEPSAVATKAEREAQARKELLQKWPNLPLMHELIDEYEALQTPESKFVYALDKLLPILNNYLDNGRNWKARNLKLETLIEAKTQKISVDPTIAHYYNEIIQTLQNSPNLFNK